MTFAHVAASSRSTLAVVTVHLSSSRSAQFLMVSITVALAFSVTSVLPLSSAMRPLSGPPLTIHGRNICEDLQAPMDLIQKRADAATRRATSRLADLESVYNDLAIA